MHRTSLIAVLTTLVLLAAPRLSPAQATHENYRYRVAQVSIAPVIDGDLSDTVWADAQAIDQFTQQEPREGQPSTERSEVRVLRDEENLYIAVMNHDTDPSGVVRNVLRFRDDSVWQKDDVVRIVVDTFHDHRRGYVFSINPLGAKQDSQVDNQLWNSDWDEVWNVKTRLLNNGWSVELAIPFRILRFPVGGGAESTSDVWGFNVVRSIKRKNESASWAPIPAGQSLIRNEFLGHLEGMSGIEPKRNLQIIPYTLGSWTRTTGSAAVRKGELGGDVKYALTSSLSLDLTYNTNFAQVEADDEQVNLTRASLRFPEKREFFLENAQIFNFGMDDGAEIFFSRRIGLSGRQPVPILGGARMSGRVGPLDVGVLTTQTEEFAGLDSTNLSAGRMRWNLGPRSYVGGILTSVANGNQRSLTFGPDALVWLGRNLRAEGFFAAVDDTANDTPNATDDVEHRKSGGVSVIYNTDLMEASLRTLSIDKGFNPALGFIPRDDARQQIAFIRRSVRLNRWWSRKLDVYLDFSYLANQRGNLESREREFGYLNQFESGDSIRMEWESGLEHVFDNKPFVIDARRGIIVKNGDFRTDRFDSAFAGFSGRALVPGVQFETGPWLSGRRTTLNLSNVWRASPHFLLDGEYELNDVTLPEGAFAAHLWRTRVSVPLTARMTTDAYLQWNSLDDTFSTQLRFHMLYARDSNLFVVFTDGRRGIDALLGSVLDNRQHVRDQALQVKLTYRLYQ
ncbi:MAG: hypothetical protein EXQ56_02465 [Acidobacteria bacterium]|nr:hypothetical protein [Acidobacteriota bacterium]